VSAGDWWLLAFLWLTGGAFVLWFVGNLRRDWQRRNDAEVEREL
jgi:hypothetical protein